MNAPETANGDTITLALNVGPISVRFEDRAGDSTALFGEMTQRDPEFGAELDPACLLYTSNLEHRAGIEPAYTGFADLRVSHFATDA